MRGFTLLELMIVILIIGVVATSVVLSIGGRTLSDKLDIETRRMQQLFQLAQDEALFKRVELGFWTDGPNYGFITPADGGEWAPYSQSGPLRARRLDEPFEATLYVDDQRISPSDAAKPRPSVLILSSGEMTPFRLRLEAIGGEARSELRGDGMGRTSLHTLESRR